MRDFVTGLRLFGRAALLLVRAPRLYLLGLVPALVTLVLFGAGFAVLLWRIGDLAQWLTPFAASWAAPARDAVLVLVGTAVLVAAGMLGVVTYTALTLLIGGPFYERLSVVAEGAVEGRLDAPATAPGGTPVGGLHGFWTGARDSVLLVLASLAWGLPLLVAGVLPLVGQTVVPVLAVGIGSWLLALELVGAPLQRRGMGLADRRRVLRGRRLLTLGTTVPAYLLCALPFTAALVMPVAVVAGTLLAREVLAAPASGRAADAVPGEVSGPRPAPPVPPVS